jgi:hypothetical protein
MPVRFGLLVAIVALLVPALSFAQPAVPDVPLEIAVPAGHKLLFKLQAKGVQIYKAVERKAGVPEWVLEAPLAELFDGNGNAGHHYDNPPAWEAADGSKVVGTVVSSIKDPKVAALKFQIVQELDRYIVGQEKAKRAVAIALRNRTRRQKRSAG